MSFRKMFEETAIRLFELPPFRQIGEKCYIGGRNFTEAQVLIRALCAQGLNPIYDRLGEAVTDEVTARRVVAEYMCDMETGAKVGLTTVSFKPSHIGLEFSYDLAYELFALLLQKARELEMNIEVDAEGPHLLERTYQLVCAMRRSFFRGFDNPPLRVAVPANQGCICSARLRKKHCPIGVVLYCIDRHVKQLSLLGVPIRVVKGAYHPGDIPQPLVNDRFLHLVRSNRHSAGATHDLPLLLQCLPHIEEIQMLLGIRMKLQMVFAGLLMGKVEDLTSLEKRIITAAGGKFSHIKKVSTYFGVGNGPKFLRRRYEEGVHPKTLFLFARNIFESLRWRMKYAPDTLFS